MSATVFAIAADRGLFKYEDKVSQYWPEFAQNGKGEITIADVLRHDAGLQQFDENFSLDDTVRVKQTGRNSIGFYCRAGDFSFVVVLLLFSMAPERLWSTC